MFDSLLKTFFLKLNLLFIIILLVRFFFFKFLSQPFNIFKLFLDYLFLLVKFCLHLVHIFLNLTFWMLKFLIFTLKIRNSLFIKYFHISKLTLMLFYHIFQLRVIVATNITNLAWSHIYIITCIHIRKFARSFIINIIIINIIISSSTIF